MRSSSPLQIHEIKGEQDSGQLSGFGVCYSSWFFQFLGFLFFSWTSRVGTLLHSPGNCFSPLISRCQEQNLEEKTPTDMWLIRKPWCLPCSWTFHLAVSHKILQVSKTLSKQIFFPGHFIQCLLDLTCFRCKPVLLLHCLGHMNGVPNRTEGMKTPRLCLIQRHKQYDPVQQPRAVGAGDLVHAKA